MYLKRHEDVAGAREGIAAFMTFYNEERIHASLDYRTPPEVYADRNARPAQEAA